MTISDKIARDLDHQRYSGYVPSKVRNSPYKLRWMSDLQRNSFRIILVIRATDKQLVLDYQTYSRWDLGLSLKFLNKLTVDRLENIWQIIKWHTLPVVWQSWYTRMEAMGYHKLSAHITVVQCARIYRGEWTKLSYFFNIWDKATKEES